MKKIIALLLISCVLCGCGGQSFVKSVYVNDVWVPTEKYDCKYYGVGGLDAKTDDIEMRKQSIAGDAVDALKEGISGGIAAMSGVRK